MVPRTRLSTTSEMIKNLIQTQIMYDNHSNNCETRLLIVAAARAREASSSGARSTRSGCLRTEEEREVSPTSSSNFRVFLALNPESKKGRVQTSPAMIDKTYVFNVRK